MLHLGCAWYPEHWPESRWDVDLQLMRDAGMTVVRVGEFAWSRMEPAEGHFDLDWLERAIDCAARQGLKIVIGTPSAAPPAWLTHRYPATLGTQEDGRQRTHGNRTHFSFTNTQYHSFCARIATQLATRFGSHSDVVGWQIDNEYGIVSYDSETQRQFQVWLQTKYGTLDELNTRWSTVYWSQEYSDWAQIPIPVGPHNPGLKLEWRRFISRAFCVYQHNQMQALRAHIPPHQWVTHNYNPTAFFDAFDHYQVSEELDFASWDAYIGTGHLDALALGAAHDLIRGLKRRNFWVMETQPGSVNWSHINNTLDPGEVRAMAWHAIGHGADAVLYWQWRSALGGQEQYHGTLVAADGLPRPLYKEVAQLGYEFQCLGDVLGNTTPQADVALLHSHDDRWAINEQRHHHEFDPVAHLLHYYRALRSLVDTVDIVHPTAPLHTYRLVVAPHLHLIDDTIAEQLIAYVHAGGHLVLGPRSGMKNKDNALHSLRQPGPLTQLMGTQVEEWYALEQPVGVEGKIGSGNASLWAEWLTPLADDVQVLLEYQPGNGWLDQQPAVTTRSVGTGRVTYIGAWLDSTLLTRLMAQSVGTWATELPLVTSVPEVEVCRRRGPHYDVFIVVNHSRLPQPVTLRKSCHNLLSGTTVDGIITLPPRGVAVFQHN